MESMSYNFNMKDQKPVFTIASEAKPALPTEGYKSEFRNMNDLPKAAFTPMAAPFQSRCGNDIMQQEPLIADPAPSTSEMDNTMNFMDETRTIYDETAHNNSFFMGNESVASFQANYRNDGSGTSSARHAEMLDTFDFFIKSLTSANNFVSMLTRDQLAVLRGFRPSLLFEFLQEVAKVRSERRVRRNLPSLCAFCKNNGENEECYLSHCLKDIRGRVVCPILRAFRCPRCGATGDRAHTIKYCPQAESGSERSGQASRYRRRPSTSFVFGSDPQGGFADLSSAQLGYTPTSPSTSSPASGSLNATIWSNFGM